MVIGHHHHYWNVMVYIISMCYVRSCTVIISYTLLIIILCTKFLWNFTSVSTKYPPYLNSIDIKLQKIKYVEIKFTLCPNYLDPIKKVSTSLTDHQLFYDIHMQAETCQASGGQPSQLKLTETWIFTCQKLVLVHPCICSREKKFENKSGPPCVTNRELLLLAKRGALIG